MPGRVAAMPERGDCERPRESGVELELYDANVVSREFSCPRASRAGSTVLLRFTSDDRFFCGTIIIIIAPQHRNAYGTIIDLLTQQTFTYLH